MKEEFARLQDYWRDEMEAAQTYERLAEAAADERSRQLLLEMRDVELRILYELKGFSQPEAERLVARMSQDQELMLEGLLRDELGLMPERFPNPWKAGAFSGGAFVVGAVIPLIAYLFLEGLQAVVASAGFSVAALFVIGVLKALFTGRSWWRSGLEMVGIGLFATVVTYLIGTLFGVQVE